MPSVASEVVSACMGGMFSASALYPLEILKTRMQAEGDAGTCLGSSLFVCDFVGLIKWGLIHNALSRADHLSICTTGGFRSSLQLPHRSWYKSNTILFLLIVTHIQRGGIAQHAGWRGERDCKSYFCLKLYFVGIFFSVEEVFRGVVVSFMISSSMLVEHFLVDFSNDSCLSLWS